MYLLLTSLVICGTVVFLAQGARVYLDRSLAIFERHADLKEQDIKRPSPVQAEPPPKDLVAFALQEATPWAQEDALKRLTELAAQCNNDWGMVRQLYLTEMAR